MQTLLTIATILNALIAGAALDKAVIGLPARRKIGVHAFANYFRATDLGPGRFWYPVFGLGGPLLTIASTMMAFVRGVASLLLLAAAFFALLHIIATANAAPNGLKLKNSSLSEESIYSILKRFSAWNAVRAIALLGTFLCSLFALIGSD